MNQFRRTHDAHIGNFEKTKNTGRKMGELGAIYGLRSTGEEFPIEASISQVQIGEQRLFSVILRDITERKLAEEALRQQASLLDLTPVLVRGTWTAALCFGVRVSRSSTAIRKSNRWDVSLTSY
jgi:hypothetical protein